MAVIADRWESEVFEDRGGVVIERGPSWIRFELPTGQRLWRSTTGPIHLDDGTPIDTGLVWDGPDLVNRAATHFGLRVYRDGSYDFHPIRGRAEHIAITPPKPAGRMRVTSNCAEWDDLMIWQTGSGVNFRSAKDGPVAAVCGGFGLIDGRLWLDGEPLTDGTDENAAGVPLAVFVRRFPW